MRLENLSRSLDSHIQLRLLAGHVQTPSLTLAVRIDIHKAGSQRRARIGSRVLNRRAVRLRRHRCFELAKTLAAGVWQA